MSTRAPAAALKLLEQEPPAQLRHSEVAVRRTLAQARSYAESENFFEATARLNQAQGQATAYAPDLLGKAIFLQGYVADLQNRTADAESKYRQSVNFAVTHKQLTLETDSRLNLGRTLALQERYSEALEQLQPALEVAYSKRTQEKTLGNLGWCHAQLGETDQAIPLLQKAEGIASDISETADRQDWLAQLGGAHLQQENYSEAEKDFQKSLSLAQQLNDAGLISAAFHNLAQVEIYKNDLAKAEAYNQKAYAARSLSPEDTTDPYLVLTTAEILRSRHQCDQARKLLLTIVSHPKSNSSLKWSAHSDLANCYNDLKDPAAAQREFDEGVTLVEKATESVGREERRMSILDAWPFYDDYIKFLIDQNNPVKALQIAEFSRARTLADAFGLKGPKKATGLQVAAIQKYLKGNNRVILAYWLADRESYLWVMTPGQLKLFHLPGKSEIEALVKENTRQVTDEHADVAESSAARNLYKILIQPAEKLIPIAAHIIVVPHRSLYSLNFETLVRPQPEAHYWIKDVTIENASSIALLLRSTRLHRSYSKDLLLIGAPVQAVPEFKPLKFAGDELDRVQKVFTGAQEKVISANDATPESYAAADPQDYRFIHFVTHGIPNQVVPLDSAVVLSPDREKKYKLYAREIKNISEQHMLNAELVTISACYSAGNKTYAGEGLVGLAWAFMRAGAHQVIGSLWEVNDETTPPFIEAMYKQIKKGRSPADALHAAKLEMVDSKDRRKRDPYYWASLQLYTGP